MEGRCEDGLKVQVSSSPGQFVHRGVFLPSSHRGLSFLAGVSEIHSKINHQVGHLYLPRGLGSCSFRRVEQEGALESCSQELELPFWRPVLHSLGLQILPSEARAKLEMFTPDLRLRRLGDAHADVRHSLTQAPR